MPFVFGMANQSLKSEMLNYLKVYVHAAMQKNYMADKLKANVGRRSVSFFT